jgi:hypothetical protein
MLTSSPALMKILGTLLQRSFPLEYGVDNGFARHGFWQLNPYETVLILRRPISRPLGCDHLAAAEKIRFTPTLIKKYK